ncbi:CapA family protein [Natronoarchaeum sp. GCM10025321]|uniref:CapA family protein n=1 Tax=Natronoarchaeum sp. GCM10025321 TaxID=3252684 RepID=UPI00360B3CFF
MRTTRRGALALGLGGIAGCVSGPKRTAELSTSEGTADVRVGFVGDVMLGRGVTEHWQGAEPSGVWGSTLDRLDTLDGLVVNLECTITENGERWPDKTYYFRSDPEFARPALAAADASIAALANNHVLDFGETGLLETTAHLDRADIAHTGAGPDLDAALEPAVTTVDGLTVAMLSLTDRWGEFGAGAESAGSAYMQLDPSVPATRALVRTALKRAAAHDPDLLVASLHWGPNWTTTPESQHEAFARWLIDEGVDVVHGHSAHVLQGVEVYRGSPIIYDAGDFVDDYVHREEVYNKRSALFELGLVDGEPDSLRLVPTEIADYQATVADEEIAAWFRETIRTRSAPYGTTVDEDGRSVTIPLGSNGG